MNKQSENVHADMLNSHPSTGPQMVLESVSSALVPENVGFAYAKWSSLVAHVIPKKIDQLSRNNNKDNPLKITIVDCLIFLTISGITVTVKRRATMVNTKVEVTIWKDVT